MEQVEPRIVILKNPPAILASPEVKLSPGPLTSSIAIPTKLRDAYAVARPEPVGAAPLYPLPKQAPELGKAIKQLLSLAAKASTDPVAPVLITVGLFAWKGLESYQDLKANHFQVDRHSFLGMFELLLGFLSIAADQAPALRPFVESITQPTALVLDTGREVLTIVKNPDQPPPLNAIVFYADWKDLISRIPELSAT